MKTPRDEDIEEIAFMLRRTWSVGMFRGRLMARDVIDLWQKLTGVSADDENPVDLPEV